MVITSTGKKIESSKKYIVGGWGSINPNVKGPEIYSLLENYISDLKIVSPQYSNNVKVIGM